jgi:hypothetical protein
MKRTPDQAKLKVTSVLAQIAAQESSYREAVDHNSRTRQSKWLPEIPPHLIDIHWINANKAVAITTIEPYMLKPTESGIQGWDDHRQKFWTFTWPEMWDAELNTYSYQPADAKEWERRMTESNLQDVDDNWVRQSHARYW